MNLPANFIRNIHQAFGSAGAQWLADLPAILQTAAAQWELTLGEPMLLSYNYVITAKRSDGSDVVLKLGVPNAELSSELSALRYFNGDGCVRLLESDDNHFMFLLERLVPGEMLVSLNDDEQCTHIACEVMSHLWRPAPVGIPFIKLTDWFASLKHLRRRFNGGCGPFPEKLVQKAEILIPELFSESSPSCLIHGDFHHYNVLSSERGWLAIDPKGVIGPPEYECGPLLINPRLHLTTSKDALEITRRRIAILSERLGFPRERIRDWGFCHAMLSAWWDLAEDNTGSEYSLACAELLAQA